MAISTVAIDFSFGFGYTAEYLLRLINDIVATSVSII